MALIVSHCQGAHSLLYGSHNITYCQGAHSLIYGSHNITHWQGAHSLIYGSHHITLPGSPFSDLWLSSYHTAREPILWSMALIISHCQGAHSLIYAFIISHTAREPILWSMALIMSHCQGAHSLIYGFHNITHCQGAHSLIYGSHSITLPGSWCWADIVSKWENEIPWKLIWGSCQVCDIMRAIAYGMSSLTVFQHCQEAHSFIYGSHNITLPGSPFSDLWLS